MPRSRPPGRGWFALECGLGPPSGAPRLAHPGPTERSSPWRAPSVARAAAAEPRCGNKASQAASRPTRLPGLTSTSSHSLRALGRAHGPAARFPTVRENVPNSLTQTQSRLGSYRLGPLQARAHYRTGIWQVRIASAGAAVIDLALRGQAAGPLAPLVNATAACAARQQDLRRADRPSARRQTAPPREQPPSTLNAEPVMYLARPVYLGAAASTAHARLSPTA